MNTLAEMTQLTVSQLSSLFGVLGPLGVLTAALAATVLVVDKYTTSGKEAAKASEASAKAFEDSANKVKGLKDQLGEINKQINEINAKDKLSPTDDAALQKLNQQKELLERDLALEQKLYKLRQKSNARDAAEALEKNGNKAMDWQHAAHSDLSNYGITAEDFGKHGISKVGTSHQDALGLWEIISGKTGYQYNLAEETAVMQTAYERLIAEQNELRAKLIESGSLTEAEEARRAEIEGYVSKLESTLSDNVAELQTYRERMTNEAGKAMKGYEDQVFQIDQALDAVAGVERDPFTDLAEHWKELQRLSKTDAGMQTSEMRHFLEVMSGKDMSTAGLEELLQTWDKFKSLKTVDFSKMFTGDTQTNLQNFWKMVEKVNSDWAEFDEKTQSWKFNISSVEELAKQLGVSEDLVNNIIKLTNEAGANIELHHYDDLGKEVIDINKAISQLKQSNSLGDGFKVDVNVQNAEDAQKQLDEIGKRLETLKGKGGKLVLDDKDAQAAYSIVTELYNKYYELSNSDSIFLKIDTSGLEQSKDAGDRAIDAMNKVVEAQKTLAEAKFKKAQGFEVDVDAAEKSAKDAVAKMRQALSDPELQAKLGKSTSEILGSLEIDASKMSVKNIDALAAQLNSISADNLEVALKPKSDVLEQYLENVQHTTVELQPDPKPLDEELAKPREISVTINDSQTGTMYDTLGKTHVVRVHLQPDNTLSVGTISKPGTSKPSKNQFGSFQGNAHAGGKWGTPRDEVALTSELGPEIVVDPKTGRWQTVGDKGAQFTRLPKGAIVFNHKQTEQLLKYGHINSRGRALASGTAYEPGTSIKGTWYVGGNTDGSKEQKDAAKETAKTAKEVAKNVKDSTDASKSAADTLKEETSNLTDWVEKVLENIDKKTEKYLAKAEKKAEAGNYSGAAKQYQKALNTYDKSIGKHGDAENLYMRQANSALSKAISSGTITKEMAATIQKRVANGAMDISKLSDGTKAVVDAYKEYYDKAVAAADATMELYDKYEETAKKMYQLPLDQASAKTDKLKNSYDLLEKKLEAATSAARKQSLMEQEITNLRQQHAATSRAFERTTDNYRTAKHRVNETTDRALSGLSDEAKAKVIAKVQQHMVIDVTALTGLTAAGKQAIIDYNAALVAQQDALHNVQMSSLETAASIDELNASIANLANDKAESKIENRHKYDDVRDAKYESRSTKGKNRMLNQEIDRYQRDYDDRSTALSNTQTKFDKLWNSRRIQKLAEEYGVQEGQKFNLKKLNPKSKDYEKASLYNATVDALGKAKHDERLAHYELINKRSENLVKIFDNNAKAMEDKNKKTFKAAEDAEKAYENLDAAVLKMIEDHPGMTYDEAMQKVLNDTQKQYEKAADAYLNMASALQLWLDQNRQNLNPEAIEGIENTINGFKEQGDTMATNAEKVGTEATDYANQAVARERDTAQRAYDEIHQKNELTRASGSSVSLEDAEAEEQALQNLITKNDALIKKLKELRDAQTIGSEKWHEYNDAMNDATGTQVSLYGSLDEVKEGIQDIKFKPLNKQLQTLQDEADKTKDHMTFMQNLGMQPMVSDYAKLIQNSRQQVDLLKQQRADLQAQLEAGGLTEAEYERIEQEIRECDAAIRQAENDQAGWAKAAQDTVTNSIQSIGGAASSIGGAISGAADAISQIIAQIIEDFANWRKSELNRIYMTITRIDTKIGTIQHDMELRQAVGQRVTADDYVQQALLLADKVTQYETEVLPRLRTEYNIQKGHKGNTSQYDPLADPDGSKTRAAYEAWQSAVGEAEQLNVELTKLLASGVTSALLDPLAEAREYISDIASLLDNISGLITDDMIFDEAGKFTDQGEQKLAIMAGQYRAVQQQAEAAKNEIHGLTAVLISGQKVPESFMGDYVAKWNELVNVADSQKQLAIEMVETMREASAAELNSLQDIIDARKDALQAKKDYYDYDKTLRGKTKDIQALQAQIAALEGLADAESKAKRARLEAELNVAQEDLDGTIQQHLFDLSTDALSNLGDTLEKAHQEEWDKVLNSVDEILKYAAEFSDRYSDDQVSDKIEQLLRSYGIITGTTPEEDITMLTTFFRKTMNSVNSGDYNQQEFQRAIQEYNQAVDTLQDAGLLTNVAKIADSTSSIVQTANSLMDDPDSHQTTIDTRGSRSILDTLKAILAGNAVNGEHGGDPNLLGELAILPQYYIADLTKRLSNSSFSKLFGGKDHLVEVSEQNAQKAMDILDKLKDIKIGNWRVFGNYASGSRRVGKDQLAWTQEHGKEEWIVRPSDGAILTPLSPDSGVLPPDITSKLWALAEGKMPTMQMPKMSTPTYDFSEIISPVVNIDNSMTVEGSVDAAVIGDLKKFKDEQREDIYQYVSDRMFRGYIHSGGKRRI